MQPRQISVDFNVNTPKKEIARILDDASNHMHASTFTPAKKLVLSACIEYGRNNLASTNVFKQPKESRYITVCKILNAADIYDDIHFLAFAIQELNSIDDWNSSLRDQTLPVSKQNLSALLAPAVLRQQKLFLGAIMTGFSLMVTRVAPLEGGTFMMLGMMGYLCSDYIVRMRLERSFNLKQNAFLTNNSDATLRIDDGLTDEFSRIEAVGLNMLRGGLGLFERTAGRLVQLTGQPAPMLVGANGATVLPRRDARIEVLTDEDDKRLKSSASSNRK